MFYEIQQSVDSTLTWTPLDLDIYRVELTPDTNMFLTVNSSDKTLVDANTAYSTHHFELTGWLTDFKLALI
jgi:hypothetical protein